MIRDNIFPSPFWHIEGAPQPLIDEFYQGAYKFKELYPSANRSNEGGYQTPFLEWKDFHPQGIEYIENVVGYMFKFKVESWWYNINGKGHWNGPHTHPKCDYALVWYLTDSNEKLVLINPIQRLLSQEQTASPYANKGDVLIFPADIMHYVLPNDKEDDRICISMNISIRDKYS